VQPEFHVNQLHVHQHVGHITFDNGSACVDAVVVGYLLDGVLPERDTRCHD
jgi:hypothetical protein